MTVDPYSIHKMPPPVFYEQPKYTWQWCFNEDWNSITVNVVKPPCLLHRIAQRWILGIHWRQIK